MCWFVGCSGLPVGSRYKFMLEVLDNTKLLCIGQAIVIKHNVKVPNPTKELCICDWRFHMFISWKQKSAHSTLDGACCWPVGPTMAISIGQRVCCRLFLPRFRVDPKDFSWPQHHPRGLTPPNQAKKGSPKKAYCQIDSGKLSLL